MMVVPCAAEPLSVDLNDPSFFDDPWSAYRRLRDEAPVYRDEKNGLWAVSRYDDVVAVATQPGLYCSSKGNRPVALTPMSLLTLDPPRHTQQRRLVSHAFTRARVEALEPMVRAIVRDAALSIAARDEVDFVSDFASRISGTTMATLLGFERAQTGQLIAWADRMWAGEGRQIDDPLVQDAIVAFHEFAEECFRLVEVRRKDPKDDLISVLAARHAGGELADDELVMFLVMLLTAGIDTTRQAITGGLVAFSRYPGERERLRSNPSLMTTAVEEILRWVSPVIAHSRTATRKHELHGVTIREGDKLLVLWQSANHDERRFAAPAAFRIDRAPNQHFAFGAGPHVCLGASLARLELRVAFEELLGRIDGIHVPAGEGPTRAAQTMTTAYTSLRAVVPRAS